MEQTTKTADELIKIIDFVTGYAYHRGFNDASQDEPVYGDHDELILELSLDEDLQKLIASQYRNPVAPSTDVKGIHVKCNDAYKGEAGEDTGSELALWHKNGGLLATIFLNDTTAKAYGMTEYCFSFDADGLRQIREYLTPTVAPSETKTACACKYPSYNAMTDRCTVCGKLYYKELTPTVAAATVAPVAEEWKEAVEKEARNTFPFGDTSYPSHDANTNARRSGFKEGAQWAKQHFEQQIQSLQAENQRLREQVQDLRKKGDL